MEREIRQCLGQVGSIGRELVYLDVVDSTNTYIKRMAAQGAPNGTVVIANAQTAGRGRLDRSFQSPEGKGIYLSVLLRPEVPMERWATVTALAGVAVCDAVEEICGVRPGLKWPNDPVLGSRKLCGILTELVTDGAGKPCIVLGIGINVLQTASDFSPEVREIATSIAQELGRPVSRAALIASLIHGLERMNRAFCTGETADYLEAYRRDCVHLGKQVQLISGSARETVEALSIDQDFGLVVRGADGAQWTVRSGEISVRGLYGYAE